MARAKETGRAEARRRYRQAMQQREEPSDELDYGERPPVAARDGQEPSRNGSRGRPQAEPVRPGITGAFRAAYHRANVREDLATLPQTLRSRAFVAAVALVLAGGAAVLAIPESSIATFAWELLVLPGSALAPQLVAGFFAPRASYLLGFIVGLLQGVVFIAFATALAARLGGSAIPAENLGSFVVLAFFSGPVSGMLFAAAAAWYRRFLALSSPRRNMRAGQRGSAKPGQKRAARR